MLQCSTYAAAPVWRWQLASRWQLQVVDSLLRPERVDGLLKSTCPSADNADSMLVTYVHCALAAQQATPFVKPHTNPDAAPPHNSLLPGHTSLLTLEPRYSDDSSDNLQQWQDTAALLLQQPGLNVEAVKLSRNLGALQLFVQQHKTKHKEGAAAGEHTTNNNNSSSSSNRDVGSSPAVSIASKLQELGFSLRAQETASAAADWQKLQQLAALLTPDSGSKQQTEPSAIDRSSHSEIAVACDEAAGCCGNSITGATSNRSCCDAEAVSCKPAATAANTGQSASRACNTTTSSSSSDESQQGATEAPTAVQVQVAVGGMTCSMCAGSVEDVVSKVQRHHCSAVEPQVSISGYWRAGSAAEPLVEVQVYVSAKSSYSAGGCNCCNAEPTQCVCSYALLLHDVVCRRST
jgi:hypothetical protein